MKCPKCGKNISPRAKMCKYCKTHMVKKSDKMARKMTINSGVAMASGGTLLFIAIILAYNDTFMFSAITAMVGVILLALGRAMR